MVVQRQGPFGVVMAVVVLTPHAKAAPSVAAAVHMKLGPARPWQDWTRRAPAVPICRLHSRNVYSELLEYKPRLRVLELFLRRPSDDTQTAAHDFTGTPEAP